jgi:hypothetical protein
MRDEVKKKNLETFISLFLKYFEKNLTRVFSTGGNKSKSLIEIINPTALVTI